MPPAAATEDDLKLLFTFVQLTTTKPRSADIATAMGLKQSTWSVTRSSQPHPLSMGNLTLFKQLSPQYFIEEARSPVPRGRCSQR